MCEFSFKFLLMFIPLGLFLAYCIYESYKNGTLKRNAKDIIEGTIALVIFGSLLIGVIWGVNELVEYLICIEALSL